MWALALGTPGLVVAGFGHLISLFLKSMYKKAKRKQQTRSEAQTISPSEKATASSRSVPLSSSSKSPLPSQPLSHQPTRKSSSTSSSHSTTSMVAPTVSFSVSSTSLDWAGTDGRTNNSSSRKRTNNNHSSRPRTVLRCPMPRAICLARPVWHCQVQCPPRRPTHPNPSQRRRSCSRRRHRLSRRPPRSRAHPRLHPLLSHPLPRRSLSSSSTSPPSRASCPRYRTSSPPSTSTAGWTSRPSHCTLATQSTTLRCV